MLETPVGAPLFHRNRVSVRLSELCQALLQDCVDLLDRTHEVVDQMREVTASPTGRLRVHALPNFVLGHLAQVLQHFQTRYPKIELEMIVNGAADDPVKMGCDCALQFFPQRLEEGFAHKLFPVRRVFCAPPIHMRRCATPPVQPAHQARPGAAGDRRDVVLHTGPVGLAETTPSSRPGDNSY